VRRDVEARRYDPSRAGTVILGQTRRKLHSFEPPVAVEGFDLHAYWPERLNNDAMHKWLRQLILESVSGRLTASNLVEERDLGLEDGQSRLQRSRPSLARYPPSTGMTVPVTKSAAGDAR
jgi:hypothetical protein